MLGSAVSWELIALVSGNSLTGFEQGALYLSQGENYRRRVDVPRCACAAGENRAGFTLDLVW